MKGISNQVREIRRVLIYVLCGSGTLEILSKDPSNTWLYLKSMRYRISNNQRRNQKNPTSDPI